MKKIFFILFFPSFLSAQQIKTDSLEQLLKTAKEDTLKAAILNDLSRELIYTEVEKALAYSERAFELSSTLKYQYGVAQSWTNRGSIYVFLGQFDKALSSYLNAIIIWDAAGNKQRLGSCYNGIGRLYLMMQDNDKALEYFSKAMEMAVATGFRKGEAGSLLNIGSVYKSKGDFQKALMHYKNALVIFTELNDDGSTASVLNNIAMIYQDSRDYTRALDYYKRSLAIKEKIGDMKGEASTLLNLGGLYDTLGRYDLAIDFTRKSLNKALEINSKQDVWYAYNNLAFMYAHQNKYKEAYEYSILSSRTGDSILNEESQKQIAEMQTKYETEKKEQQITLLNKDAELKEAKMNRQLIVIWSVAAGFIVVLLLSMFIYKERKKSEKLLLNILPAETARELKAKGKATARQYESVTVMFTDFKGFTTIAEKLSAEELVSELDFLFRKFDEIISRYHIEKIKTIGDAYMCASGLPTQNTDHATQILRAAMEMQEWMTSPRPAGHPTPGVEEKDLPRSEHRGVRWQLRIGIHTGPVTAGVVGDKKFAYDIWGDTVNIASRMESSGEAGKINISGATYERLISPVSPVPSVSFTHRGKIPAKNKGEIDMYFAERA